MHDKFTYFMQSKSKRMILQKPFENTMLLIVVTKAYLTTPCRWVLRLPPLHSRGRGWLNRGRRGGYYRTNLGGRLAYSVQRGKQIPNGAASLASLYSVVRRRRGRGGGWVKNHLQYPVPVSLGVSRWSSERRFSGFLKGKNFNKNRLEKNFLRPAVPR